MKKSLWILVALLLIGLSWATLEDKETLKRLISVSGSDYVEVLPDTAYFRINVSVEKSSPEEAAKIGEQLKQNIRVVLAEQGIAKEDVLEDVANIYSYAGEGNQTVTVFSYTNKLRINDFTKIAPLRQALFNAKTFEPVKEAWFSKRGLSADSAVSYELVKNKNLALQTALKKAYAQALGKIGVIADTSKLKYSVYRVNENSGTYAAGYANAPMAFSRAKVALEAADNNSAPAVEETTPTLQRVYANVTVTAEIL
jgi:uncharacterized protein YggE